jgi:hypothetical protein
MVVSLHSWIFFKVRSVRLCSLGGGDNFARFERDLDKAVYYLLEHV